MTIDSNDVLPSSSNFSTSLESAAAALLSDAVITLAATDSVGTIPTDALPIDSLKYGRYYNSFFASGLAALLILVGLFLFIGYKKYQRTNPMGIMFNLVLI